MGTIVIMILAGVVCVGLMILGLSITLIRRGRPLQSDIGDNESMRELGIECAAAQMRREESLLRGEDPLTWVGCGKGKCEECAVKEECD